MISSILVIVVGVILFLGMSFNLIWLLGNALKEKDKYLITLSVVCNVVFWLSIIVIALKYFGL
ncbi:hypothetical protein TwortDSMZ_201 [Staphylococcus phage Twort]|uniref:Uncharacterized protein n=2 Tax=Staphylococcus phage Twort (strain DSM 17442 / HER 48) TaxID=2908167 RepID=A0A6H0X5M0_BPTWO|nr:ORF206 [Staphylococcus phage Twort]AAX92462.1 ORF206 [Staphylococcus phage Twort]QIW89203.1 hypothetical protein TwortDSMZ_012 [Staphylococcus phage Twort]QIW89220.1 hypothetical protein TwortDSMZ_201 [Staphylococcus phage Twort]